MDLSQRPLPYALFPTLSFNPVVDPRRVNGFLPIYTYGAYKMQGFGGVRLSDYQVLADQLVEWGNSDATTHLGIHLKGIDPSADHFEPSHNP